MDAAWASVAHDSRDAFCRTPGWGTTAPRRTGAVPAGTTVTLRVTAPARRLDAAALVLHDGAAQRLRSIPLSREGPLDEGREAWRVDARLDAPTFATYAFRVTAGGARRWLGAASARGGRALAPQEAPPRWPWRLTVHDPGFRTPAWHRRAVAYEVLLDSFRNGDPSNDPRTGDARWRGFPHHESATRLAPHERRTGRGGVTFYGGDLAGLREAVPHLADLGVGEVYLLPWCKGPDYHGYAVDDPFAVEPAFGTLADFDAAVAALRGAGIRVVGDLVLNHLSAQGAHFERARASPDDPHARWFAFHRWPDDYEGWNGLPTLPVVQYHQAPDAVDALVAGEGSVVAFWMRRGLGGVRLDASVEFHDGAGTHALHRAIRARVKSLDPDAVVMAEAWGDASPWLTGHEADATMDYRFRDAVLAWLRGDEDAARLAERLQSVEEDVPREALLACWRMLGSHDTPRVRTALRGDRDLHHVAAVLQFCAPGVPLVYYGDEVGMEGGRDPDNRSYMTWEAPDAETLALYRALGRLRRGHPALAPEAGFEVARAEGDVFAFVREAPEGARVEGTLDRAAKTTRVALDPPLAEPVEAGRVRLA